jgi:excisionase family DNA binding protein
MLTTTQAAAALGITPSRVRQLIYAGELDGHRVGPIWLVESASVARYSRDRRPRGNPAWQKNSSAATP